MRPEVKAVLSGVIVGGGVFAFLLARKVGALSTTKDAWQMAIEAEVRTQVEEVAKKAADEYLGEVYGATPERISKLSSFTESIQSAWSFFG